MIFRNFITLDGVNYEYEAGSWTRTLPIRSSINQTQNVPTFSYDGIDKGRQQITLAMNTANTNWGTSTIGASQMALLETTLSKKGSSMPIVFVNPVGLTYNVVPNGDLSQALASIRIYGNTTTPIMLTAQITLLET